MSAGLREGWIHAMDDLMNLAAQPAAWAALATLIVLEVVLGIDNLIFVSILSNKLPEAKGRRRGESASVSPSSCGWSCSRPSPGWSA
jgi:hypothetical protein